jgi:hypothetical protein
MALAAAQVERLWRLSAVIHGRCFAISRNTAVVESVENAAAVRPASVTELWSLCNGYLVVKPDALAIAPRAARLRANEELARVAPTMAKTKALIRYPQDPTAKEAATSHAGIFAVRADDD